MRLPASRIEQFKDWLFIWVYCVPTVSSFSLFQWSALVQAADYLQKEILKQGSNQRGWIWWIQKEYIASHQLVESMSLFKCAQLLHSKQNERWEMPCAGRWEKFETAKVESLSLLWYKVNTLSNRFNSYAELFGRRKTTRYFKEVCSFIL